MGWLVVKAKTIAKHLFIILMMLIVTYFVFEFITPLRNKSVILEYGWSPPLSNNHTILKGSYKGFPFAHTNKVQVADDTIISGRHLNIDNVDTLFRSNNVLALILNIISYIASFIVAVFTCLKLTRFIKNRKTN